MVTLLTVDGVEDIDYTPSDAEIRAHLLGDRAVYGFVLAGVTWIRSAADVGFWTIVSGRRVSVVPAACGWCWCVDGRGYWTSDISCVAREVRAIYGDAGDVEDDDEC